MRNIIFAGIALTALAATPAMAAPASLLPPEAPAPPASLLASHAPGLAALAYAPQSRVQVWLDGGRDVYRPGERVRVRVRSQQDGYLAVFHIDTNGDVDIIYPRSEAEDGWIDGGRTLTLGSRNYDYVRSRGGYGMGYIMAVTLDEPLELWRVREMYGIRTAGWDGNRGVFGDPFYAMDELVRAIVPEGAFGYEGVDYATYHVGRRYRYPRYACYDGYGDWYSYRGAYWNDCDRVRILLVSYPWYYDTHRWRGSRRVYYERYYYRTAARNRPLHGYKERTDGQAPPARSTSSARRPEPQRRPAPGGGSGGYDRPGGSADGANTGRRPEPAGRVDGGGYRRPDGGTAADRPAGTTSRRPDRGSGSVAGDSRGGDAARTGPSQRPTRGSTRPQQQDDAEPRQQDRPVQPSRERPTFQRRPQNEGGSSRSAEPRRESPPQRSAEPRRESPPPRSAEPRRESPPARSAEPRRESPPARSAEPRRESRPPSSSSSGGSRSSGSSGGSRSSSPPPPRSPDQ
jgi:hypothetical protein